MICQERPHVSRGLRSVKTPGGNSQHFRVQIQDSETHSWRMYASFRFSGEAEACLAALAERGIVARLVSAELCPTAG